MLGHFATQFAAVRWLDDERFKSPCPLPGHPDGDFSILAREVHGRIQVACFGGLGHTSDQILGALGLSADDLRSQNGAAKAPKSHAETFSSNGATTHRDFGRWQLETGYQFKQWFSAVPEKERELLASSDENALVETLVSQAKEWMVAEKRPLWPPPELNETELDEEFRRLAVKVVQAFREDYLPAIAEEHLPTLTGEINRDPIDAYDAYQAIRAAPRIYPWDGLDRQCCTLVLTALIGSGKTTLSMNVVWGWSYERAVLDRPCLASKTLVVVSPKEYEAWVDTIGFWGIRGKVFIIPSLNTQYSTGLEQAQWFQEKMRKYQCGTFVLDTMFDFYGIPPHNTGDANRMAMAEQTPLLECVRLNNWCGIVTGHSPKSEAQAIVNRDPEEAFAGHTAWTAMHRMRAVIRRKAKGVSTFLTGRGGLGDQGILEEQVLKFDETTRLVSLGGDFSKYLGETALPSVLEALRNAGGWVTRSDLVKLTGKSKNWVHAAMKYGLKKGGPNDEAALKWNGKERRASRYALIDEPAEQPELL